MHVRVPVQLFRFQWKLYVTKWYILRGMSEEYVGRIFHFTCVILIGGALCCCFYFSSLYRTEFSATTLSHTIKRFAGYRFAKEAFEQMCVCMCGKQVKNQAATKRTSFVAF